MLQLELTKPQISIIKEICGIEIEALTQIIEDGPEDESKFIIEQHEGVTEEDLKVEVARMRTEFFQVLEKPALLFQLEEDHISIFKHVLLNLEEAEDRDEDCVTVKYPMAVKNIWRKLFAAEEWQNMMGDTLAN